MIFMMQNPCSAEAISLISSPAIYQDVACAGESILDTGNIILRFANQVVRFEAESSFRGTVLGAFEIGLCRVALR